MYESIQGIIAKTTRKRIKTSKRKPFLIVFLIGFLFYRICCRL